MATPQATRTRTEKKPLGRRSKFRSRKLKEPVSFSLTPEARAQLRVLVKNSAQDNNSTWLEDVIWKIARRRRPL